MSCDSRLYRSLIISVASRFDDTEEAAITADLVRLWQLTVGWTGRECYSLLANCGVDHSLTTEGIVFRR